MKFSSTPTEALERYAKSAEAEQYKWESIVAECTIRLAVAKGEAANESRMAGEYRSEIERRRQASDD